jgi:hypothetical protein
LLDGCFSGHQSIRDLLDFVVFVEAPVELQRTRFVEFYRWKGLTEDAIEALWRARAAEEWPAIDVQRGSADFVMTPGASTS